MKSIGRLAIVALMTSFAAVAAAQEPPPEQEDAQQSPPDYPPPPQQYAPPPTYAPPASTETAGPPAALTLGAVGQIAISDDLHLGLTYQTQSFMGTSTDTTTIILNPAVDVFLAPNFSLGGQVLLGMSSSGSDDSTAIGIAPRIGYNIPLGSMVSLWPRISVLYVHDSDSTSGAPSSTSSYRVSFNAVVPVLFQPAPHFFIGGGPYLSKDLTSKLESMDWYKNTLIGLQSTIGGYFGGM